MLKKYCYFLCLISFTNINVDAQHKLLICFKNIAGNQPLQKDSMYKNEFGELFTVHVFKYYISNIVLQSENKTEQFSDEYFLIDDADSSSKKIELNTNLNHITSLKFLLGIDSVKNVSGVQTGSLDPAKGMFWVWNTGYVMAKLEGKSASANTPQHAFSYHVGGYKQNENTSREISFKFLSGVDCSNKNCTITISADVLKWFNAINEIRISETPFCHEPGSLATKLADNYAQMFNIVKVE